MKSFQTVIQTSWRTFPNLEALKYLSPKKGAADQKEVKTEKNKMIQTHQTTNIYKLKIR